jgi:hypothetical protein
MARESLGISALSFASRACGGQLCGEAASPGRGGGGWGVDPAAARARAHTCRRPGPAGEHPRVHTGRLAAA